MKIKKSMDAAATAAILNDLAGCFKEGKICIESGKNVLTLKPEGLVGIEIEAERKKGKQKIMIEMTWRDVPEPEPEADEAFLKISSAEPEIKASETSSESQ